METNQQTTSEMSLL